MVQRVTGRLIYVWLDRKDFSENFFIKEKVDICLTMLRFRGKSFLTEESESGKGYDYNRKRKDQEKEGEHMVEMRLFLCHLFSTLNIYALSVFYSMLI